MKIERQHAPRSQFQGPITALMLILKHVNKLTGVFAGNNDVTQNIFGLLYEANGNTERKKEILSIVETADKADAQALRAAFSVAAGLNHAQQVVSVDYMNSFMRKDATFLRSIGAEMTDREKELYGLFRNFSASKHLESISLIPAQQILPLVRPVTYAMSLDNSAAVTPVSTPLLELSDTDFSREIARLADGRTTPASGRESPADLTVGATGTSSKHKPKKQCVMS